ncbi:mucin-2-like [Ruditapes philippinarum]|uniref:mucin-2-like n=1 Tax=Ruditapes philippinarum TaxID=129788 RepID=UPI00295B6B94|nr:mucin-2-like [Ruditapes philippinarum]
MTAATMGILPYILLLSLTPTLIYTVDNTHTCNNNEYVTIDSVQLCSKFIDLTLEGWNVDKAKSNFSSMSSAEFSAYLSDAFSLKTDNRMCTYRKNMVQSIPGCCGGWEGTDCLTPVCTPTCLHGECVSPGVCACTNGMSGLSCDERPVTAHHLQYCFKNTKQCSGEKLEGLDYEVTEEQCCEAEGGSWGRTGMNCTICPPKETSNDADDIHCVSFGTLHRTFDGVMYNFDGGCTYNMASDMEHYWQVQIQSTGCGYDNQPSECRKAIVITSTGTQIKVDNGTVTMSGEVIHVPDQDSVSVGQKTMSLYRESEFLFIYFQGVVVKYKVNSVYIHIERFNNRTITGLCGNANFDVRDDFGAYSEGFEFGNAQKINIPNSPPCSAAGYPVEKQCSDLASSLEAEVACSTIYSIHTGNYVVHPKEYYDICVRMYCTGHGKEEKELAKCSVLEAYVYEVSSYGLDVSWRSSYTCPKECPKGMTYSQGKPLCKRTCKNLYMAELSQDECQQTISGCECVGNTFLNNNNECVEAADCPCIHYGKYYSKGDTVMMDCNKCTCEKGRFVCESNTCSATCSLIGYNHISTLDGKVYDFDVGSKSCEYTMFKTTDKARNETGDVLDITLTMKECTGVTNTRCVSGIQIQSDTESVEIELGNNPSVYVDGSLWELPYVGRMKVKQVTTKFIYVEGIGFTLVVDNGLTIYLNVQPYYEGKVTGMCGNFNALGDDDLEMQGVGQPNPNFVVYGYGTPKCRGDAPVELIDSCMFQYQMADYAETVCAHLLNSEFIGEARQFLAGAILDVNYFYDRCRQDMCRNENMDVMCWWTSALSKAAENFNLHLDWNFNEHTKYCEDNVNNCHLVRGSVYSRCVSPCKTSCRDLQDGDDNCEADCIEGCHCPANQYVDAFYTCVPKEKCTCYDEYNREYRKPYDIVQRNCDVCTCINSTWDCIEKEGCNEDDFCPGNQIFLKGNSCPYTCENYDKENPTACSVELPHYGCGCEDGLVIGHNGTCIPFEKCPCVYGSSVYGNGETLIIGCKVMLCENQGWTVVEENECMAMCYAAGDPHYQTFDNRRYSFQGSCSYTMAKAIDGDNSFEVTVENMPCGSSGVTCTKSISITINGMTMKYVRGESIRRVNALEYESNGVVVDNIGGEFMTVIWKGMGLILKFDAGTRVYLYLGPRWKGKVQGLCGNYDGIVKNEFGGTGATALFEYLNSMKKSSSCPDLEAEDVSPEPCKGPLEKRRHWSEEQCGIIQNKDGIFKKCIEATSQEKMKQFYEDCVFDGCACDTGGDCECLCSAVANFAEHCNSLGLCIRWRSNNFCGMQCENGKVYQGCGGPAPQTCENIGPGRPTFWNNVQTNEGCFCPDGQISDGDGCKPISECECYVNGTSYPPGYSKIENCKNCTCKDGLFDCEGDECKPCEKGEYKCQTGVCIPGTGVCDGIPDCDDGTDEYPYQNCTCQEKYLCPDGITCATRCDGYPECSDDSDEDDCQYCKEEEFRCYDGDCLKPEDVCDGICDCDDTTCEDELQCTTSTSTTTTPTSTPTTTFTTTSSTTPVTTSTTTTSTTPSTSTSTSTTPSSTYFTTVTTPSSTTSHTTSVTSPTTSVTSPTTSVTSTTTSVTTPTTSGTTPYPCQEKEVLNYPALSPTKYINILGAVVTSAEKDKLRYDPSAPSSEPFTITAGTFIIQMTFTDKVQLGRVGLKNAENVEKFSTYYQTVSNVQSPLKTITDISSPAMYKNANDVISVTIVVTSSASYVPTKLQLDITVCYEITSTSTTSTPSTTPSSTTSTSSTTPSSTTSTSSTTPSSTTSTSSTTPSSTTSTSSTTPSSTTSSTSSTTPSSTTSTSSTTPSSTTSTSSSTPSSTTSTLSTTPSSTTSTPSTTPSSTTSTSSTTPSSTTSTSSTTPSSTTSSTSSTTPSSTTSTSSTTPSSTTSTSSSTPSSTTSTSSTTPSSTTSTSSTTPSSTTSTSSTTSSSTTSTSSTTPPPCTLIDGMKNSVLLPTDNLYIEDSSPVTYDVNNLRPSEGSQYETLSSQVKITLSFIEPVVVGEVGLFNPVNVNSYMVFLIASGIPMVKTVNDVSTTAKFIDATDVTVITITIFTNVFSEPASFSLDVKICNVTVTTTSTTSTSSTTSATTTSTTTSPTTSSTTTSSTTSPTTSPTTTVAPCATFDAMKNRGITPSENVIVDGVPITEDDADKLREENGGSFLSYNIETVIVIKFYEVVEQLVQVNLDNQIGVHNYEVYYNYDTATKQVAGDGDDIIQYENATYISNVTIVVKRDTATFDHMSFKIQMLICHECPATMVSAIPENVVVTTNQQEFSESIFTEEGVSINPAVDGNIEMNLAEPQRTTTITFTLTEEGYMNTMNGLLNLFVVFYYNGRDVASILFYTNVFSFFRFCSKETLEVVSKDGLVTISNLEGILSDKITISFIPETNIPLVMKDLQVSACTPGPNVFSQIETSEHGFVTTDIVTVIEVTFIVPVMVDRVKLSSQLNVISFTVTAPEQPEIEEKQSAPATITYLIRNNFSTQPLSWLRFSRNVYGFLRILLAEERRATRISFDVSQQVYKVKVECLKIVDGHLVVVETQTLTVTTGVTVEILSPQGVPVSEIRVYFEAFVDVFSIGHVIVDACQKPEETTSTSTTTISTTSPTTTTTSPTTSTTSPTTSTTSPTTSTTSPTTSTTSPTTSTTSATTSTTSPTTSTTSPTTSTTSSTTSTTPSTTYSTSITTPTSPTTSSSSTTSPTTSPTSTTPSTTSSTSTTSPSTTSTTSSTTSTSTSSTTSPTTSQTSSPTTSHTTSPTTSPTTSSTTSPTTSPPPCLETNGMADEYIIAPSAITIKAYPANSSLSDKLSTANETELNKMKNSLRTSSSEKFSMGDADYVVISITFDDKTTVGRLIINTNENFGTYSVHFNESGKITTEETKDVTSMSTYYNAKEVTSMVIMIHKSPSIEISPEIQIDLRMCYACRSEMIDTSIVVQAGNTVVNKYLSDLHTIDVPFGVNELIFRFDEEERVTAVSFNVNKGQVLSLDVQYFLNENMIGPEKTETFSVNQGGIVFIENEHGIPARVIKVTLVILSQPVTITDLNIEVCNPEVTTTPYSSSTATITPSTTPYTTSTTSSTTPYVVCVDPDDISGDTLSNYSVSVSGIDDDGSILKAISSDPEAIYYLSTSSIRPDFISYLSLKNASVNMIRLTTKYVNIVQFFFDDNSILKTIDNPNEESTTEYRPHKTFMGTTFTIYFKKLSDAYSENDRPYVKNVLLQLCVEEEVMTTTTTFSTTTTTPYSTSSTTEYTSSTTVTCNYDEKLCPDMTTCYKKCNGVFECDPPIDDDELECETTTTPTTTAPTTTTIFTTTTGTTTVTPCLPGMYTCEDGTCIPPEQICNGPENCDCMSCEDELGCTNTTTASTSTPTITTSTSSSTTPITSSTPSSSYSSSSTTSITTTYSTPSSTFTTSVSTTPTETTTPSSTTTSKSTTTTSTTPTTSSTPYSPSSSTSTSATTPTTVTTPSSTSQTTTQSTTSATTPSYCDEEGMETSSNYTKSKDISVTDGQGRDLTSDGTTTDNLRPDTDDYFKVTPTISIPYVFIINIAVDAINITDVKLITNNPSENIQYAVTLERKNKTLVEENLSTSSSSIFVQEVKQITIEVVINEPKAFKLSTHGCFRVPSSGTTPTPNTTTTSTVTTTPPTIPTFSTTTTASTSSESTTTKTSTSTTPSTTTLSTSETTSWTPSSTSSSTSTTSVSTTPTESTTPSSTSSTTSKPTTTTPTTVTTPSTTQSTTSTTTVSTTPTESTTPSSTSSTTSKTTSTSPTTVTTPSTTQSSTSTTTVSTTPTESTTPSSTSSTTSKPTTTTPTTVTTPSTTQSTTVISTVSTTPTESTTPSSTSSTTSKTTTTSQTTVTTPSTTPSTTPTTTVSTSPTESTTPSSTSSTTSKTTSTTPTTVTTPSTTQSTTPTTTVSTTPTESTTHSSTSSTTSKTTTTTPTTVTTPSTTQSTTATTTISNTPTESTTPSSTSSTTTPSSTPPTISSTPYYHSSSASTRTTTPTTVTTPSSTLKTTTQSTTSATTPSYCDEEGMETSSNYTKSKDISVTDGQGRDLTSDGTTTDNLRPDTDDYFKVTPPSSVPYVFIINIAVDAINITDVKLITNNPSENIQYAVTLERKNKTLVEENLSTSSSSIFVQEVKQITIEVVINEPKAFKLSMHGCFRVPSSGTTPTPNTTTTSTVTTTPPTIPTFSTTTTASTSSESTTTKTSTSTTPSTTTLSTSETTSWTPSSTLSSTSTTSVSTIPTESTTPSSTSSTTSKTTTTTPTTVTTPSTTQSTTSTTTVLTSPTESTTPPSTSSTTSKMTSTSPTTVTTPSTTQSSTSTTTVSTTPTESTTPSSTSSTTSKPTTTTPTTVTTPSTTQSTTSTTTVSTTPTESTTPSSTSSTTSKTTSTSPTTVTTPSTTQSSTSTTTVSTTPTESTTPSSTSSTTSKTDNNNPDNSYNTINHTKYHSHKYSINYPD